MSSELSDPVVVDFPLRGEGVAFNSPGDRVPSHGTDMLGQRFAYDFIRVDRRKGWQRAGTPQRDPGSCSAADGRCCAQTGGEIRAAA